MKTITCKIDNITVKLVNVREVYGHDDSLPFNAELCIHNPEWCNKLTFVGRAWNDGWGGDSVIDTTTKSQRELVDKLDNYLKENYQNSFGKYKWNINLLYLVDCLANYALGGYKKIKITDFEGVVKKEVKKRKESSYDVYRTEIIEEEENYYTDGL